METKVARDILFLKWYAGISTVVIIILIAQSLFQFTSKHFKEIDAERINIVERDGTLKMVISNKESQHPGLTNFKQIAARERQAGIIFFNSSGDECGGLIYDGDKKTAGFALSIDQFRNDQVMQLQYDQTGTSDSARRTYGLRLWDRSDNFTLAQQISLIDSLQQLKQQEELIRQMTDLKKKGMLGVERMFAGKNKEEEVGLFIRDNKGRVRIKIYCDKENNAKLVLLDEAGNEQSIQGK
jgi:hypothetical protein